MTAAERAGNRVGPPTDDPGWASWMDGDDWDWWDWAEAVAAAGEPCEVTT